MTQEAEPTGSVDVALAHTERLLEVNPRLAIEQAGEILKVAPNHPVATLLLGLAQRRTGDAAAAAETLTALVDAQHRWARAHFELGVTLGEVDQPVAAARMLQRAVQLKPDLPDAWRALGDVLTATGDTAAADRAYASHIRFSTRDPRLRVPALALHENRIPEAETQLREHLKRYPTDVAAIRMLAEVAGRLGRNQDAEHLLERCLELAPSFDAARHNYALILNRQNKPAAALQHLDQLLARAPLNPAYRNLKAVLLARIGDYRESIEIYRQLLDSHPEHGKIWMSYGHALATAGHEADSVAAYRRCIDLLPDCGEAYWSLANLKTFRFSPGELQAMQEKLAGTLISEEDRYHFHFALGKALEDGADYAASFGHYELGNELRRKMLAYDPAQTTALIRRSKSLLTAEFLAERSQWGAQAADPIFIVGLPRAGSTLIEQILASHSLVEGTMELPHIVNLARRLSGRKSRRDESRYPEVLAQMTADSFREMGEQYLEETRIHRHLGKPFFIDKMPNNFLHLGLIQLMLPQAKIIDARRHPMACCFSGFKQHFARGQGFSYSLADVGMYYRDYVELMAHFDAVMPGRIHRVIYESMVMDTATEVGRLLAYCGLPFEEGCLRFHENARAVRTASAQQVRQPIFRSGVDHWRHYEPWLAPLKAALGPVLDSYPESPSY